MTLTLTTTQHAALVEDYADRHAGEFATRAAARKYGVHVITRRWGKVAAAGWIAVAPNTDPAATAARDARRRR